MAEFTADGYLDLRDYIEANWDFVEIRDDSVAGTGGAAVLRIDVSDPRVAWAHVADANPLVLEITLAGSDADITPPVTLRSAALYKVASGGVAMAQEVFAEGDAPINADSDQVTVTLSVEEPSIP